MRRILLAALVAAFFVHNAYANGTCTNREKLINFLTSEYSETLQVMGLVDNSGVMEIYVSEKGTWTIVVTSPKGTSCVIGAGDNWEAIEPHYPVQGRDG